MYIMKLICTLFEQKSKGDWFWSKKHVAIHPFILDYTKMVNALVYAELYGAIEKHKWNVLFSNDSTKTRAFNYFMKVWNSLSN